MSRESKAVIVLNNVQRARVILTEIPVAEIDAAHTGDEEIRQAVSALQKAEEKLQKLIDWKFNADFK